MLVHGANLSQKEIHKKKYTDDQSRQYLTEIRDRYNQWHQTNVDLIGPSSKPTEDDREIVTKRVHLLEDYKDFIDQQLYAEHFDSRSNLHSTVIEEFLYYLVKDLVKDFGENALIGKSHAFKDIFFVPPNYTAMLESSYARIEVKDHDFVIGVTIQANLEIASGKGVDEEKAPQIVEHVVINEASGRTIFPELLSFDIAAVAIECKTYLDKTMLEGSSRAAEELKARNPNALYLVVMEWLKLTNAVNLRKYQVDQIYVLRRQKNTDRELRFADNYVKKPIDPDVIWHLFETVRKHLTADWETTIESGIAKGWLL